MRRALAAFVRCLPMDAHGRRALDEAFLDWSHEQQAAQGIWSSFGVQVKGVAGIGRAVGGVVVREFVRVPTSGRIGRVLAFTIVPTLLLALQPLTSFLTRRDLSWLERFELGTLVLPQAAFLVLPVALFLVVAVPSKHGSLPAIGLSTTGFIVVLGIGFWAAPEANQRFRVTAYAIVSGVSRAEAATALSRGPSEESLSQLVVRALNRPSSPAAGTLLFKSGWSVLGALLVLLAAAVSTLSRATRRLWTVAVPLAVCLGVSPLGGALRWGAHGHAMVGLVPWVMAVGVAIIATAIGRNNAVTASEPNLASRSVD